MLNIRKLTEKDWDTLVSWWDSWPEWQTPSKDFLPDNGKGGLIIEKDGTPIVLEVNPRPSGSSVASMECGVPLYRDLLELFSFLNKTLLFIKKQFI